MIVGVVQLKLVAWTMIFVFYCLEDYCYCYCYCYHVNCNFLIIHLCNVILLVVFSMFFNT